jgi:hypothetical protein
MACRDSAPPATPRALGSTSQGTVGRSGRARRNDAQRPRRPALRCCRAGSVRESRCHGPWLIYKSCSWAVFDQGRFLDELCHQMVFSPSKSARRTGSIEATANKLDRVMARYPLTRRHALVFLAIAGSPVASIAQPGADLFHTKYCQRVAAGFSCLKCGCELLILRPEAPVRYHVGYVAYSLLCERFSPLPRTTDLSKLSTESQPQ